MISSRPTTSTERQHKVYRSVDKFKISIESMESAKCFSHNFLGFTMNLHCIFMVMSTPPTEFVFPMLIMIAKFFQTLNQQLWIVNKSD
mmetsp:Transcript_56575/g.99426  ORF Transcript_56575/g.99426 Transcript_56575/m.99426 type:complete len:88 (+) Transcript_56575:521-784(+)